MKHRSGACVEACSLTPPRPLSNPFRASLAVARVLRGGLVPRRCPAVAFHGRRRRSGPRHSVGAVRAGTLSRPRGELLHGGLLRRQLRAAVHGATSGLILFCDESAVFVFFWSLSGLAVCLTNIVFVRPIGFKSPLPKRPLVVSEPAFVVVVVVVVVVFCVCFLYTKGRVFSDPLGAGILPAFVVCSLPRCSQVCRCSFLVLSLRVLLRTDAIEISSRTTALLVLSKDAALENRRN